MSTVSIHPHPRRRAVVIDPSRQIEGLASAGMAVLYGLDGLGGRILEWAAARRLAAASKNRISATSIPVIAGVLALAVFFAWTAFDNTTTENAWLTAGPAGAAMSAPALAVPAPSSSPATASAAPAASSAAGATSAVLSTSSSSKTTRKAVTTMKMHSTTRVMLAAGATAAGAMAALAAPAGAQHRPAAHASAVFHENLSIVSAKQGPEFTNSKDIVLPANSTVVLTIRSFDDGAGALPSNVIFYDKVMGTVGGKETVNGKAVSSVSNKVIAHTFTIPSLGINLAIPAAPTGKSVLVQATIHTGKAGTYSWQCYDPCGSGKDSEHGVMDENGYMKGTVTIH